MPLSPFAVNAEVDAMIGGEGQWAMDVSELGGRPSCHAVKLMCGVHG